MTNQPRRILPGRLYELTVKTFQDRYFFVPSERLNAVVLGALAYAANKYGLRICYTVWMSNHRTQVTCGSTLPMKRRMSSRQLRRL